MIKQKSKSQILRASLFRVWETKSTAFDRTELETVKRFKEDWPEFENYYNYIMDNIIKASQDKIR